MDYLIVVLTIGFLITIHEFGHLIAAKSVGVGIKIFSVGFGPKLLSFKKNETEYRLSLIPLGGYVLPEIENENELFAIPIKNRIIFALGGPAANIFSCLLFFMIGNLLVSGFSLSGILINPFIQLYQSLSGFIIKLPQIFSSSENLSSLVDVIGKSDLIIGGSFLKALSFAVMLNINLAVFNLLPIPPLDGGKIVLYLLEKLHPKALKLHIPVTVVGWVFMIGTMLFLTFRDVARYL